MGIYLGMFRRWSWQLRDMESPGESLLNGKMFMYLTFGNDYWVPYHFRIYNILGDPSIHVWKEIPLDYKCFLSGYCYTWF